jgi:transcription antitermination factor NusG
MLGDAIQNDKDGNLTPFSPLPNPAIENGVPQWFAAYVNSRHEKSVVRHLDERCVESFLPLYQATHRWKNGRHQVQLPLFPGYVFVRFASAERTKVLQVPGVNYIVGNHGVPTPLRLAEIEGLRNALKGGVVAQPYPYLKVGTRVEIRKGPLEGLVGILQRRQGQYRVVISVDLIMQSVALEVDVADVAALRNN